MQNNNIDVELLKEEFRGLFSFFFARGEKRPKNISNIDVYKSLIREVYDSLKGVEELQNSKILFSDDYPDVLKRNLTHLHSVVRRFNNSARENRYELLTDLFDALAKAKIYLVRLTDALQNDDGDKNLRISDIESINYKIKELYYDISSGYQKIQSDIDKAEILARKLSDLEEKQRKLISTFNVNNESYKEKISIIDVANDKVNLFNKNFNLYDESNERISENLSRLEASFIGLESKVNTLESGLVAKEGKLDNILSKAEDVLGKSSTAALGKFFKEQYDHSKELLWVWPVSGLFFIAGAIAICIVTVFPDLISINHSVQANGVVNPTAFIISRLVVAPLFLIGAWFSANQYVKRKNIIEDYAYKKVLSLSLLAFKDEIEKTGAENTTDFIKTVQRELFKSPLESLDRKHLKRESDFLKSLQTEMMNGMLKNVTSVFGSDGNTDKNQNKDSSKS